MVALFPSIVADADPKKIKEGLQAVILKPEACRKPFIQIREFERRISKPENRCLRLHLADCTKVGIPLCSPVFWSQTD